MRIRWFLSLHFLSIPVEKVVLAPIIGGEFVFPSGRTWNSRAGTGDAAPQVSEETRYMAQIFHPSTNTVAKASIVGALVLVAGLLGLGDAIQRSPYTTRVNLAISQNVPFSHKHHANLGIDCRYCHTTVEESSFANIPPTRVCMNCHTLIWNDSPMLQPVRDSWATGESLQWNRVHDLPQFVYFNHSIHVSKGIGCATCHGRVDQMPLVRQANTLYMGWCLDCHRQPEKFIRPRDMVTQMDYQAPANQLELGAQLVKEYNVDTSHHRMLDCYNCHR